MKKIGTVPVFLLLAGLAQAQDCRVLDAELQEVYSGPCVDGLAEGPGYARGRAEYRGEFKAGMKHGRGVKSWPNGDRYEGEFADDRKEGQGLYVFGRGPWAGERYEGAFAADRREGHGVYRWPSGDVYRGPWKEDRAVGAPTPMMLARARFEAEARAALRPGVKVCKELEVGIGGRDWIRGVVADSRENQVAVRIEDAGREPHFSGERPLESGTVLLDSPAAWVPCI